MKCVKFFVQNEGQSDLACFSRNWNIPNIMKTILILNQQLGMGVISYSFCMERHGSKVTIPNDAISINPETIMEDAEFLNEKCSASDLFAAFTNAQSANHSSIYVFFGNDLIQFISKRITVDVFDPVTRENEITDQWINDSTNNTPVMWYIPNGPNAGHHALMTFDEAERDDVDGKIVD